MKSEAILDRILDALEKADLKYMLTGSLASSFHGTPRATQDIDIVIEPDVESLRVLIRAFPETAYYVSEDAAFDALREGSQFNVIDLETGWKVDFIFRKQRPFSLQEFQRRQTATLFGRTLFIVSAEDILIAKLEWARLGGSERQLEDAAGILRTSYDRLDFEYIQHWVRELGLQSLWKRISASVPGSPEPG